MCGERMPGQVAGEGAGIGIWMEGGGHLQYDRRCAWGYVARGNAHGVLVFSGLGVKCEKSWGMLLSDPGLMLHCFSSMHVRVCRVVPITTPSPVWRVRSSRHPAPSSRHTRSRCDACSGAQENRVVGL